MKKRMGLLAIVLMPGLCVWAGVDSPVLEQGEVCSYHVEDGLVEIKGDEGLCTLPFDAFSSADQKKITDWATDLAFDRSFGVKIREDSTKEKIDSRDGLKGKELERAKKSYTVREEKTGTYTLKMENKSEFELRNISVESRIFYERKTKKRREDEVEEKFVKTDKKTVTLAPGETTSLDISLMLVNEEYTSTGRGGGHSTLDEDLKGILVVASYTGSTGEKLVCESNDGRIPDQDEMGEYKEGSPAPSLASGGGGGGRRGGGGSGGGRNKSK